MSVAQQTFQTGTEDEKVAVLIARARAAMEAYENDDQARVQGTRIVHGFICHASRHGSVADYGDDIVVRTL